MHHTADRGNVTDFILDHPIKDARFRVNVFVDFMLAQSGMPAQLFVEPHRFIVGNNIITAWIPAIDEIRLNRFLAFFFAP